MKKPKLDLGPKLNRAMAQPQAMITRGVRQVERPEAEGRPPADMQFPLLFLSGAGIGVRDCYGELMHLHEKPISVPEKTLIALQRCKSARPALTK
jgi:hypothetical protein